MKFKVVQYGVGKMSKYTMRYVVENGWKLVGAFDIDTNKIGKDISIVMGGKNYGVNIQAPSELKAFLLKNKPDIVIITTMSLFSDIYECVKICAECGVNAITTCEEAFFPQNSNPKLFNEINKLAIKNNCTICGSGYQDVYWGNLVTDIAGSTQTIKKIIGKSSYNVEDYGIALARAHGAGLTLKEFEETIANSDNISEKERAQLIKEGTFMPSYMWNVNGWLASKLGLTITSQIQKCIPEVAKKNMHSTTLEMDIKKGKTTGMSAVVISQTKQGPVLETRCIGKVYDETEYDMNEWTIEGEPTTTITVKLPQTVELTCATIVNRIPDVVNAQAGYVSTENMPSPKYHAQKK